MRSYFCREFILAKRNTSSSEGRSYVLSQEIVDEFPTASGLSAAEFRAILRELCTYSKIDGAGRWTLKDEFS